MEKIELTDSQREQIQTLAPRLTQAQLADYLGFSERTLRNIFDRDEKALAAYKMGRALAVSEVAGNLIDRAIKGDTASQIFYLKTQAGWKETQELQVTAPEPFDGFLVARAERNSDHSD